MFQMLQSSRGPQASLSLRLVRGASPCRESTQLSAACLLFFMMPEHAGRTACGSFCRRSYVVSVLANWNTTLYQVRRALDVRAYRLGLLHITRAIEDTTPCTRLTRAVRSVADKQSCRRGCDGDNLRLINTHWRVSLCLSPLTSEV